MKKILKVGVIGSGTMGSGIAAQALNGGANVVLLDIASDGDDKNKFPQAALDRMVRSGAQGALMDPDLSSSLQIGNLEDNLDLLSECDWIIEAVIEDLSIKQELYRRIEAVAKPDAVLSSNTSTFRFSLLSEKMSEAMKSRFLIAHFFNPPRHMRLIEIVGHEGLADDLFQGLKEFIEGQLGKTLVYCHDRPGFIANRFGLYWMLCALHEAIKAKLTIAEVDELISGFMGVPKTGVFGLMDLIGIDLIVYIQDILIESLEADDPLMEYKQQPEVLANMVTNGTLGRKSGAGFSKRAEVDGKKAILNIDLFTGEYLASSPSSKEIKDLKRLSLPQLFKEQGKYADYMQTVLSKCLNYAAFLVGDAADDPVSIDEAMRLGYNWRFGPFELIDKVGVEALKTSFKTHGNAKFAMSPLLSALDADGVYKLSEGKLTYFDVKQGRLAIEPQGGGISLSHLKIISEPVLTSDVGNLWDLKDGVACLEITTKMGALSFEVLGFLKKSLTFVEENFQALVLYNEGRAFAAGADLKELLANQEQEKTAENLEFLEFGQQTMLDMKHSKFPIIGAPSGMALGGGCELLLHCNAIVAHAETNMGLVELLVGLLPGWNGCYELMSRLSEKMTPLEAKQKCFDIVSNGVVSKSAHDARKLGFLRETDDIIMNKGLLLLKAKERALAYTPAEIKTFNAPQDAITLPKDDFSEFDGVLYKALADCLDEGENGPEYLQVKFIDLLNDNRTIDRIKHMLQKGKPLKN